VVAQPIVHSNPPRNARAGASKPVATFVLCLTAFLAALAWSDAARAAEPCAKAILADWQDNGRVDRVYELPCYEAAIDAIPTDLRDYIDAEDVITRAFHRAAGRRLAITKTPSTEDPVSPLPVPPIDTASSPSAIPVPLLVLGGMSLMLLAAGGIGYLSRRRSSR
jgi:hypothetical protein